METVTAWAVPVGIAVISALLCWKGRFWSACLILALWLGLAVWAWSSSTDLRHLDYALDSENGDPRMIFSILTVFFGLPIYILGALAGCALHFRKMIGPSQVPDIGETKK